MSADVMEQKFVNIPSTALVASILFHLAFPTLLVTLHVMDNWGWLPFLKKKIDTREIYQNFIQVDVVALPDELPGEKSHVDVSVPIVEKPLVTKDEPTTAPKQDVMELAEKAAEDAKKKQAKQKAEEVAQEKVRKKEEDKALKKIREEADREAALKGITNTENGKVGRQKLAGNITSKGTSMTGKMGTPQDQYNALVVQAIRDHIHMYPWQQKRKLKTVVRIDVYPNGRVRTKQILKPSADKTYDSALMSAIDEAQPLPLPSDPSLVSDGIVFTFSPE